MATKARPVDLRAHKINQLHAGIKKRESSNIEDAWLIGQLLEEEKAETPHGLWLAWVDAELDIQVNQVNKYKQLYTSYPDLKVVLGHQFGSIREAIEAIPRPEPDPIYTSPKDPDREIPKYTADPDWEQGKRMADMANLQPHLGNLLEALGISPPTKEGIKWLRKVSNMQFHPDRGGCAEKAAVINQSLDTLEGLIK